MSTRRLLACLLFATSPAFAQPAGDQPPPPPPPDQPTPPPTDTTPPHEQPPPVEPPPVEKPVEKPAEPKDKLPVHSKWDATLYGFVEFDSIVDSTQGLNDLAGSSGIAKPGSYTGDHGQLIFGARNSRLGVKLAAPVENDIKVSGQLEMDFLGNQPGTPTAAGGTGPVTEQQFWQNPTFRFRHMNVKAETPYVDILIGQYWQLFGWQTLSHPNTVQIQGVPGQVYSRSPQIRVSKTIKAGPDVNVEIAIAASRPPQRASATPDGQGGVKVTYNGLKAWRTAGSTGSSLDSLGVGVSVVGRHFAVNDPTAARQRTKNGYGLSIDALIPILPATKESHGNALTLTGNFVIGAGLADLYQSLSGGVSNQGIPAPVPPAAAYAPNIDGAMVLWAPDATDPSGLALHSIQWTSYMAGLQYYLPGKGNVWLSANYSHQESANAHYFGATWDNEDWADGCLFVDVTHAFRLGGEFAWANQSLSTTANSDRTDYRGQFSAFFLF